MSLKRITDPLESAKVVPPSSEPLTSKVGPLPAPTMPAPEPPPPSAEAVASLGNHLPHYRVVVERTVSWGGQMLRLTVGKIVSDEMGPGTVDRLREAGVELDLVDG